MSMPVMALFIRALRVESRTMTTYLGRLALVGVILYYLLVSHASFGWRGAPGLEFFKAVLFINFFFITLGGLSYFASAISEEKEEMTLGLLRMTHLSPVAILLGKSTSRLAGAVMFLLVQAPFTLLAVTLGGVSFLQIAAAYATFLAYLVFLSGLAVFCSVVADRTSGAAGLMGLLLGGFYLGPPIGKWLWRDILNAAGADRTGFLYEWPMAVFGFLGALSPFNRIEAITRTGFSGFPVGFQAVGNALMGAGFFLLAWASFDLFTRQQKESAPARTVTAKQTRGLRLFNPGRAWADALAWKDFNFIAGGRTLLIVKFILYGLGIFGIFFWLALRHNMRWSEYCTGLMFVMLVVCFAELVLFASRVFNDESRYQTLSSLGALPMSTRAMAYRKALGCLRGVIPSAAYGILALLCSFPEWHHFDDLAALVIAHVACHGIAFLHLVVYLSLRLKRGAVAVAIGLWVFGMMIAVPTLVWISRDEAWLQWAGIGILVVFILVLHRLIGRELEKAMAA